MCNHNCQQGRTYDCVPQKHPNADALAGDMK